MIILALIILCGVLYACSKHIDKILPKQVYNLYSNVENGHKEEEAYLLKSSGVLKVGNGKMPWISEGQLFNKAHFKLCKVGSTFTLRYHSFPLHICVEHVYKAEEYGDYVIIRFVSQEQKSMNYLYEKVKMFQAPVTYMDYSCYPPVGFELTNETGKNLMFFAEEMKAGESVTLRFIIDQSRL